MVRYSLDIFADLDGLTNFQPRGGCDDPDFSYYIKMRCDHCGEMSEKWSCVILSEKVPLPDGKGSVHLFQKCKMCGKEGTIKMIPGCGKPFTDRNILRGVYECLMLFDCNGSLTPIEVSLGTLWKAKTLKGNEEYEIDLSNGEFAEYNETLKIPVSVSNLKSRLRVVRQGWS